MRYAKFKNQIFFTLALFFTYYASFESSAQEGFSIGIKAGAGYSQYFFQKNIDQNFVQVFQKGLFISYRDKKNFGIQFEIMQTQKAWEEQINSSYKKRIILEYYEFPLFSTYKFGKGRSGLVIMAGLHFSYTLKADSSSSGQQLASDTSLINYSPLIYSKFDYGLEGGLGYQFVVWRGIFQIDVMYSQGLQNLFERNYIGLYRSLNQNLYLNLSLKVSLAKKTKQKAKISSDK
jgi:hypothetical protein